MKSIVQFIALLLVAVVVNGQDISKKLKDAIKNLESDEQMQSGFVGFYVVKQKDGAVVLNENGSIGLPVASSQKVITSVASLEMLGADYHYKTILNYDGEIVNSTLDGNIYLSGFGDPTLGSWRYNTTKDNVILNKWIRAIEDAGIKQINGNILVSDNDWETQTIPGGWIWDDIGNYYGAGVAAINWHENQYDLKLRSGNKGDNVSIVSINPTLYGVTLNNELKAGKAGSGDNAYIYLPPYATIGFIRGTIPPGETAFTVSGSFPDPIRELIAVFTGELEKRGIEVKQNKIERDSKAASLTELSTHLSPSLDSINYWFLRKSINLYGEALVKTIGFEKKKEGSTEAGLNIIRSFWKERGIEPTSINMADGSGLSPTNRVTAEALVKVMQYARNQAYFSTFYNALPEFNEIKMKSGSMGGVRSFTGYVNGYTFAIVVNNYNGSSSEMIKKMYKVLNLLK
jgi:D-alanyl-D-alanine carboxypeptidase/D-alanyl-D-alanine-endopeptidase (penicillin-binding protein 4)